MKNIVVLAMVLVMVGVGIAAEKGIFEGSSGTLTWPTSPQKDKFYITAPWICNEPIISYGVDRIDALANSGVTVWTENEWKALEKRGDKLMPKEKGEVK